MLNKFVIIGGVAIACSIALALNLTSAKEPKGDLYSFHFGLMHSAYKSGYSYDASINGNELFVGLRYSTAGGIVEKKRAVNNDTTFLKNLDKVIKEQQLYKWNGFKKSSKNVLDGSMFGLYAKYRNGKEIETIEASGSNAFPDGYKGAQKAIEEYFKANVEKLPTVKDSYTFAEVKPEVLAALKYMEEKKIIKNNVGGEVFSFSGKGDPDLAIITIDIAMDPGHAFQLLVRNHKILALKVVAADGKNITPQCAVIEDNGKLQAVNEETYKSMILRKDL